MIQSLAPRMPRGFSWAWIAFVAIALNDSTLLGQIPPAPAGGMKPVPEVEKPAAKEDPDDDEPTAEVFIDPNAKRTLSIVSPLIYNGPSIKVSNPPDDRTTVQRMAARDVNTNPDFLKRYVEFFAVELSKRDYLNALINPPINLKANASESRGLERAVDALTKPIIDAKGQELENREFLAVYTKILFESSLTKLLENNYLTRIDAMIVLGMAGGTTGPALDLYISQLKKPDQVIWVKLWAARGLSNAAQNGAVDLEASKANQATEALVALLESDPKLPWPVQMRALEALGSLRVASANMPKGRVDAASVAMRFLADDEARPEVRSWAAWALGMMKIPAGLSPYNFALIGHGIGELAVDIGDAIVKDFDDDPANFDREKDLSAHLTGLLLFQVCPALIGQEGPNDTGMVRDSGLLRSPHSSAASAKPFLAKVDEKVKAVTKEAYELLRSAKGGYEAKRNDLESRIADLKAFLGQSSPKDRHLVPGGPEFNPAAGDQVAGAARP